MPQKIKISCYIRTLNEKRLIGEVVEAAFKIADEVIIVDSGSTDGTRDIAASKGARVVEQEWLGNGFQKRVAEDLCANDWLLDLDADEIVTDELALEISNLFSDGEPLYHIYEIPLVIAPTAGKPWFNAYVRPHTKLYDRRFIRIPAHKAWDHFKVPKEAKVGRLQEHILHYAYVDIEHMIQKVNGWSSLGAREGKRKSNTSLILRIFFAFPFYFLRQYIIRNLWRAGVDGFNFAVITAFSRWLRDVKMLELKNIKPSDNY